MRFFVKSLETVAIVWLPLCIVCLVLPNRLCRWTMMNFGASRFRALARRPEPVGGRSLQMFSKISNANSNSKTIESAQRWAGGEAGIPLSALVLQLSEVGEGGSGLSLRSIALWASLLGLVFGPRTWDLGLQSSISNLDLRWLLPNLCPSPLALTFQPRVFSI